MYDQFYYIILPHLDSSVKNLKIFRNLKQLVSLSGGSRGGGGAQQAPHKCWWIMLVFYFVSECLKIRHRYMQNEKASKTLELIRRPLKALFNNFSLIKKSELQQWS